MNLKYFSAIVALLLVLVSCEDNSGHLGVDMMPAVDMITKNYKTYDFTTSSYAVGDSVLARSSISYLGRFTDPETGTTIKSDFLTQLNCLENTVFPDSIIGDSAKNVEILLYTKSFVGDSLTSFKLSVYELDKPLNADADYYTNIDATKYYDVNKAPLATKWFTLADYTISDSARYENNKEKTSRISISVPNRIGNTLLNAYHQHPEYFKNSSAWMNSNLPASKGLYFKLESGDGAIVSIDICQLNITFDCQKDTTVVQRVVSLAATEEVVQATRFENYNLDLLLSDTEATYLKSPAGIFTVATLPVDQLNANDTINSAKLVFTRYNDKVQSSFKLGIPANLLLVRLDDYLNGFFEKYLITDNQTSYLTTFSASKNSYVYNNVAKLVTTMLNEKKSGKATENWNKVLLIPVEAIYDGSSSPTLVKLNHDFSISSSRLVGGKDGVQMEVIYTHFAQ